MADPQAQQAPAATPPPEIDLSAGFVPKPASQAPPQDIDLSAGFQPKPKGPTIGPQPKGNLDISLPETVAGPQMLQPLTMPLVKGLIAAHDKLKEVENMTQEGQQAHPIQAHIGALANRIEGLLTGTSHGEAAIGTGQYGMLNNPVTGSLLPTGEGTPVLAEGLEAGANAVKEGYQAVKGAVTGGSKVAEVASAGKTPVEAAVQEGVKKSGLTTGAPASTAPTGQNIQPQVQAGIRNAISDVAKKAGVDAPTTKSMRGVIEETADKVEAQSKAIYRTIDAATDGRFQPNADALKNVNLKLRDITGLDDEKEAELIAKKQRLEWQQDQMFDEATKKGVPKEAIDAAKSRFKQAQALYDTDAQLKAAVTGRAGIGKGIETVDPNKLVPRLHKLYDSGRLQEAVGEDGARALIEHAENAQSAMQEIKDFVPSSPTGKNALQDILTKNTEGKAPIIGRGKIEGKTNWNGAVKDFENMTSEQQTQAFGSDVGRVRQFLGKQALRQNAATALKIAGGTVVGGGLTAAGYEAVTH